MYDYAAYAGGSRLYPIGMATNELKGHKDVSYKSILKV